MNILVSRRLVKQSGEDGKLQSKLSREHQDGRIKLRLEVSSTFSLEARSIKLVKHDWQSSMSKDPCFLT